MRTLVRDVEPDALISTTRETDELRNGLARERFTTALVTSFAILALLLSAVGLYSVLSQVVARRSHEIGVRVSLGADPRSIRRLVLRPGLLSIATGLAAGGLLAFAGIRLLDSHMFGFSARRPTAWLTAAAALCAVSLAALWTPVERGARINPIRTLRSQ